MRLIGELADPKLASRFSAYLIASGIPVKSDTADDGTCEIWVHEEDQFDLALKEFQVFQSDSGNSKYAAAVPKAQQMVREQEKKRRAIQKKIVHVGAGGVRRKPALTLILIGLCALVSLFTDFGEVPRNAPIYRALQFVSVSPPESEAIAYANPSPDSLGVRLASIKRGEIWRLVTPIFIHYGIMHIVFNMLWLFQLGQLIENRYGTWRFGILVLLTAAIPIFFQCTVPVRVGGSPPGLYEGTLITSVGGMSGVVYGLLGYVWIKSIYDRASGFFLPQSTLVIMLGWMFLCMVPGLSQSLIGSGVANWAHGVGLVVGLAVGYAPTFWQKNFK
jgi:GlpG protein